MNRPSLNKNGNVFEPRKISILFAMFLIAVIIGVPLLKGSTFVRTPTERPNILLLVGHDFGWSDIDPFGAEISTVIYEYQVL